MAIDRIFLVTREKRLSLQTCKIPHPEFQLLGSPRIRLYHRVPNGKYDVLAAFAVLGPERRVRDSVVVGVQVVHEGDPGAGD